MAIEYPSLKVPDLKKLLQERGLVVSGNKAELISRLQEDDKKSKNAGEDEIDWDEDEKTTSTIPAAVAPSETATALAPASAPEPTPLPTPTPATLPIPAVGKEIPVKAQESKTDESVAMHEEKPPVTNTTNPTTLSNNTSADIKANVPKETQNLVPTGASKGDYSLGLTQSDSILEAEKRAARAKRFGIPQSEESIKMAERAKKFRIPPTKDEVIQSLDTALPERRPKRMHKDKDQISSRPEKRQEVGRRSDFRSRNYKAKTGPNNMTISAISNDPVERAKAEARAKRFARPVVA